MGGDWKLEIAIGTIETSLKSLAHLRHNTSNFLCEVGVGNNQISTSIT
ncbi:MAG: hypothetical protein E6Q60_06230 [Nitrosomonas oligotropha]|uniref:Uncharacterized protein n=1 Tax=Nitrosomonas oligotropha TaxID=42354 RepID=A0A5C7VXH5_9PROT|nr:MAG: hypothetical protein E6Q60_06230 [Nitrosomonas oligotropha]